MGRYVTRSVLIKRLINSYCSYIFAMIQGVEQELMIFLYGNVKQSEFDVHYTEI
ncbi:hypothetical protein ACFFF5_08460 [Lederbergia wuyishanensis]|uniref:Maturase K n=1 Tax=Lederbergia wuyishanensis TaxID=1347903 RepID=A0ABU0D6F5_9BACI|nr:hypothetical protein [Lederbergia wuyishanensis]MCJ8008635.1 hypothetical protein [Lederbergia wuyishanensis]MDQ0343948.1 hypothetical protein [Lederbergia wuyishanensis]